MWLEEDLDAALEWHEWKGSLCPGCGNQRHDTLNPNGPRYVADSLRCRACEARDHEAHSWREDRNADPAGIYFTVTETE